MRAFADGEDTRNVHSKSSFVHPVIGAGALAAIDITTLNAKMQRSRVCVIAQRHRQQLSMRSIAVSNPGFCAVSKAWLRRQRNAMAHLIASADCI
ncbi:hypothetical protein [Rhodopseudomonas sp. WA056]|uniref:hypothetical protein n=1 Tax=Rhodopseudomonas sp. WA056 TaxID=2269367 RepID=UPI0013E0790A|nr:hypothetical protein [Rhodopseudomonas sp. WA056]